VNDEDARRLLDGIDGPRPLPSRLRGELESVLVDGLTALDAPRAVPDDLRARLEATLGGGTALPASVRRRLLRPTAAPARVGAAAAAVLALLGGLLVATSRDEGGDTVAAPGAVTTTTIASAGATSGGSTEGGVGSSGATAPTTTVPTPDADASAGQASGVAAAPATAAVNVALFGTGPAHDGFQAWLDAHGGTLGGRRMQVVSSAGSADATVNLGEQRLQDHPKGVVFETAFVEESSLGGVVASLSSTPERQARVAVARAVAGAPSNTRAAVYVGSSAPWSTTVADAIEHELDARGISHVRVPFAASAPAFVPADVAFLSIDAPSVRAWVDHAPSAPRLGVWGVGSSWDEGMAAAGSRVGLRAASPFAVLDAAQHDALQRQLGKTATVSAAVVHGWVTAAALDHLLRRNGDATLTAADLDALRGWSSGWAPPYDVRPRTRSRVPDAVILRATTSGFRQIGEFQTTS
jgi:hypothetical protein